MNLFCDIARTNTAPANHVVADFEYLNTSARAEAGRVRQVLTQWLDNYPARHRANLVTRFRSQDDQVHQAAFFELFLHQFITIQGFRVLEIEPILPNGRSPDFLVETPQGVRFYLEGTVATGTAPNQVGTERRVRDILQTIDNTNSPFFFLEVGLEGEPTAPVSLRNLRRHVQTFVDGLDYEEALALRISGSEHFKSIRYEENGVTVQISAIAKSRPYAGERAIGIGPMQGGFIQPHAPITRAVQRKAARYGELDIPLVVAVNAQDDYASDDDAVDALFGTESVLVRPDGSQRVIRNTDGAWRGPHGPVYTRCSAVLFVSRLRPWSLGQRKLSLFHNPWAQRSAEISIDGCDVFRLSEERLEREVGQPVWNLLGLPDGWPG